MPARSPNFSVTGFHLSVVKKPKPKVCSAGNDPTANATITPLNSSNTTIAAARVNWRKAASPTRSRSSTLARAVPATDTTNPFGSATSTTERLRTNPKGAPWPDVGAPISSGPPTIAQGRAANLAVDKAGRLQRGTGLASELLRTTHNMERLAARIFYVAPCLLDLGDDFLRHRHVIKFFGHLVAVSGGPGKKFKRLGRGRGILRLLRDQDECRRGHRPGFRAGLIGENDAITGYRIPIGVGRRGLESRARRANSFAVLVDQLGIDELVLQRIGVLDVADRPFGLAHVVGDTLVAFGADTVRPFPRSRRADLRFPIRTDLAEIGGEVECRARAVRAMDHSDGLCGQVNAGIEFLDRGIVPGLHRAEKDGGDGRTVEDEFAGLESFDIHYRDDSTHHHRELHQTELIEFGSLKRSIGGAESNGLGLDLFDSAPGTDGLIIEPHAGVLFVHVGPLGIDRVRKRRPGARNFDGGGWKYGCGQNTGSNEHPHMFHGTLLSADFWTTRAWPAFAFVRNDIALRLTCSDNRLRSRTVRVALDRSRRMLMRGTSRFYEPHMTIG